MTGVVTIVTNAIDEPIQTGQRDPPAASGRPRARDGDLRGDASSAPGEGQPAHTALLGDWAIGKTTLLMHWRRLRRQAGDAVVLSMAYPLTPDQFLSSLVVAIEAELATDWSGRLDLEVGLDLGVADARLRRPARSRDQELRATMRRLVDQRGGARSSRCRLRRRHRPAYPDLAMFCCGCARCALELYAADVAFAFVVAASPSLFAEVRSAHEPLVRFFQPLTLGPLDAAAADSGDHRAARRDAGPIRRRGRRPDRRARPVAARTTSRSLPTTRSMRPTSGRVSPAEFAVAFERAFASVSQEIFAGRWAAMSPIERQVVGCDVARSTEPRPSGEIEAEAALRGVNRQRPVRLFDDLPRRATIDRVADGHRGRYAVSDRLFRRYLELQTCEP